MYDKFTCPLRRLYQIHDFAFPQMNRQRVRHDCRELGKLKHPMACSMAELSDPPPVRQAKAMPHRGQESLPVSRLQNAHDTHSRLGRLTLLVAIERLAIDEHLVVDA